MELLFFEAFYIFTNKILKFLIYGTCLSVYLFLISFVYLNLKICFLF